MKIFQGRWCVNLQPRCANYGIPGFWLNILSFHLPPLMIDRISIFHDEF